MEFWIEHPSQSMPVSLRRWIMWHLAELLGRWSRRLEWAALYPDRDGIHDEIPF